MTKGVMERREVRCAVCQTVFWTTHSMGKYCSDGCRREGERKSWRDYGSRNAVQRKEYRDQYYRENSERIIERTTQYHRSEAGRAATRANDQRQRQKFPEKHAARQAVLMAVRKGELVKQPCSVCGNPKSQAHHHDYAKPLEVTWLCRKHHDEEHRGTVGIVMEDGRIKGAEPQPQQHAAE